MKILDVDINDIKPYAKNAKKHPDEQIARIANSIREFGFRQPLVIDKDNVLVIGHGRLAAAKRLGYDTVPCVRADDLTEEQIKALRLADNKTNESDWDFDFLDVELDDITDIDMGQFGFDLDIDTEDDPEIVEDEIPEDTEARTKLGDVWQLGEHTLICGDCTDITVIDTLMGGVEADMVFTDPPYNVAMSRSKVDGSDNSIKNDNLDDTSYDQLLRDAFSNAVLSCNTHNMYWWIGFREYSRLERIFKDNNIDIANCIVWDKGSIGLGGKGYRYQHELCIFSGEINNNSASDVWQYSRSTEGIHPTMKPVALIAHAISNIDNVNTVLDMFGGSGSTLIACEQLGRKCYMCELDEHYCDVIIQRWENLTGKEAVLLNGTDRQTEKNNR